MSAEHAQKVCGSEPHGHQLIAFYRKRIPPSQCPLYEAAHAFCAIYEALAQSYTVCKK